ncbi:MAG TPA: beta-ketoacyl synthase N-terminal-like domain-containing protein [Steroidobacteraceae bacterium]|jgi:3-oxoacyl-[acyl-carrier-protein] synthase-1
MSAVIGPTNVLCSIGRGSEQAWASARAGIAGIGCSHVMDRNFNSIQMGLVPEDALGKLTPDIEALPLPSRARRLLRLAVPALQGLAAPPTEPVRMFLGMPQLAASDAAWLNHFLRYIDMLSGTPIDLERSVIVTEGRAAALMALELALDSLAIDPSTAVIVGGVDTHLDLRLLNSLDAQQRLLGPQVMDGFIPGEGAAFFMLSAPQSQPPASAPQILVNAAASVADPGHRYGTAPARGEGLSAAIEQLRARMETPLPAVGVTFAGFNGENFDAKLWGVARLRHNDFFAPSMPIEHPADKYGDAGAATGAILTALAATSLADGSRNGPALVWAASDREPRACALLSVA